MLVILEAEIPERGLVSAKDEQLVTNAVLLATINRLRANTQLEGKNLAQARYCIKVHFAQNKPNAQASATQVCRE